jgi:hypothetical protein
MTDFPPVPTAVIAPPPTRPDHFVPPDPDRTAPLAVEVSEQPDGTATYFDVARHAAARYAVVIIRTDDGGWQLGTVEPEDILEHGMTAPDGVRIRLITLTLTDLDPTVFGEERDAWAPIGAALERAEQDYNGKAPR